MANKDFLNNLLAAGKTGEAILHLLEAVRLPEYAAFQHDVLSLSGQYNNNDRAYKLGNQSQNDAEIELNRINQALLGLIQQLPAAPDASRRALSDYHRHTCDRVQQSEAFSIVSDSIRSKKTHFFYLYGGQYQSHEGLFRRIGYDLEGRLEDYLNPDMPSSCKVLKLDLTFDTATNPDIYKKNVLKSLFAALDVPANLHGPLLDKNLNFVCENSPAVKGLAAQDFICILLTISQYDWDSKVTPVMVRWLIEEFCAVNLPNESPVFLFFFAIKYEEDDEALKAEVHTLVNNADSVNDLPELAMVPLRDIGRWFEKYKHLEPDTRKRQERMKALFSTSDYYMEDVEIGLKKIIDEYNKWLQT